MATYLDTSALVKLIIAEPESEALRSWLLAEDRSPVTCDLARIELVRAVRRLAPEQAPVAVQLLESVTVTEFITYDDRQTAAAATNGITVTAPA